MDRLDSRTGYLPAFQAAVGHVHGQVLGNYTNPYPNPNPNPNPSFTSPKYSAFAAAAA